MTNLLATISDSSALADIAMIVLLLSVTLTGRRGKQ